MFITQRELDRRIEKAVKEAHDKWEGELWRDKQLDSIRQQIDTLFRERYDLFDKLNERVYVLERKTGVINPPEPLKSCGHPARSGSVRACTANKRGEIMNSNYSDTKKLEEAFAKAVGGAWIEETPEEPEVRTVIDLNIVMDAEAMQLVGNYVWEHLDRSDEEPKIEIYIVWKAKILKNWKYLISTNLNDGMYYELTLNGEKDEWYLDAYKKFENRRIPR